MPSPRRRRGLATAGGFLRVLLLCVGGSLMNGWIDHPSLGAKGVYLCPWGAFGRAPPCLARDLPWERRELGFHKISLV
jgi:hypothetical protein